MRRLGRTTARAKLRRRLRLLRKARARGGPGAGPFRFGQDLQTERPPTRAALKLVLGRIHPYHTANPHRSRRQGDRITIPFAAVHESAFGTKRTLPTEFQCPLLGVRRSADGRPAGRGESLRGDDPAEQHAFVYRAGVRPGRSSGLRKVELFLNLKTAKALGYRPVTPVGPR